MLLNDTCSDLIIELPDNKTVGVHRAIIHCRIPQLYDLLLQKTYEKDTKLYSTALQASNISYAVLCKLLHAAYTGAFSEVLTASEEAEIFACLAACQAPQIFSQGSLQLLLPPLEESLLHLSSSGIDSDITLTLEQSNFLCHKCILCGRSPYFKAMFFSGMQGNTYTLVFLVCCRKRKR